jgi:serine/threonine protein kinase/tetratricopeptide (TPR) repeat protein
MAPPEMALSPGTRIGAYEVLTTLGEGGMGEVYRAHDPRLGRDVALKVLPADMAGDPTRLERFTREARAIAALNHPHIVTIYSTEEAGGVRFLTMELVEGRTLDAVIPPAGLALARFLEVALQLSDALTAAHQKQITHRDLKPANVMVANDGRVKVLDFGLARVGGSNDIDRTIDATRLVLTSEGIIVGTMPYMSPEQVQGKALDHRTDLFSLGVMFHEMLVGARPFTGESSAQLMSSILRDRPASASDIRPEIPEVLSGLVHRCLEKRPDDRVQTARDVYNELKHLQRQIESGALRRSERVHTTEVEHGRTSIAVLPFADMSPQKDQDWFCDGVAEEILNALTPLQGLRVAARTSAFSFRNQQDDLHTIGEKLGVATVLQGSVRRAGDRIRVTVQLVDVTDGFQLWSERYDRKLEDVFDVQDDIARAVARRLKLALVSAPGARLVAASTSNMDAYELYLKGQALLYRRGASVWPALDQFRRAVELDAEYAAAWAGIANTYVVCAYFGMVRGSEARRQGLSAARRALALDPSSADAHTALGGLAHICQNDLVASEASFLKALELNPSHVQGRCWYSLFCLQAGHGRFDAGVAEARRARDADPLSAYVATILNVALINAGQPLAAVEEGRRAVGLDPLSFVARWALGMALLHADILDEAESVLDEAAAMSGRHPYALVTLARTCARKGSDARARDLLRELESRAVDGSVPCIQLAGTAEAAGDRDTALTYARRALDEREPGFVLLARHWPDFIELRRDPRFVAMIRELDEAGPFRSH